MKIRSKKYITTISVLALFSILPLGAQSLIPYPDSILVTGKSFVSKDKTLISANESLRNEQEYLSDNLNGDYGQITLVIDTTLSGNVEHYQLTISRKGTIIKGKSPEAVFDGIQTLLQYLKCSKNITPTVIDDQPQSIYRALLLDPSRHFLPLDDVKRYIDEMARYKFNILQMHLTDDQGVRIEIKSHPELTEGIPHYTQQELKDLILYAHKRHVEIVPEVDIPGHTFGILNCHPELLCNCVDTTAWGKTLRTDVMLCASKPGTYTLISDILQEVCELFPSKYIHLGGDESVIEKNWGKCTGCKSLCNEKHLTSNNLMGYFFNHFLPQLRIAGKSTILWCEMDNIRLPAHEYLFHYPKNVTLVTWRNALTPKAIDLTCESGNPLILAPGEHCYFDYPQWQNDLPEFNNWGMPILSLKDAYCWKDLESLKLFEHSYVVGVMGTLWGEAIPNINRAFYMTYPRALALSEVGWTKYSHLNFESFLQRLPPILSNMMQRGIPYRAPWECYKK